MDWLRELYIFFLEHLQTCRRPLPVSQEEFFKRVSKNTSLKISKNFRRKLPQLTAILMETCRLNGDLY